MGLGEAREAIRSAHGVVFLTGAGVSAESGIPTFRDTDGFWGQFRFEDLATPEGFERDPRGVWEWYALRRRAVLDCHPNPGHLAIARFLRFREDSLLATQNVDGLHQRALHEGAFTSDSASPAPDSPPSDVDVLTHRILELHGSLLRSRCSSCGHREGTLGEVDATSEHTLPRCPSCTALMRPDVVWFGELLDQVALERAFDEARTADVCVVVGTSALVHPAASLPAATVDAGGTVIEVNPEVTPLTGLCKWSLRGKSAEILPELLAS